MKPEAMHVTFRRVQNRLIDELIGICRGVLADGYVCEREAEFIDTWIKQHPDIRSHWTAEAVVNALPATFESALSEPDQQRLIDVLLRVTGDPREASEDPAPTALPLTDPPPPLTLVAKACCFTGIFAFGTRRQVWDATTSAGGIIRKTVSSRTDLLIVGDNSNPNWLHSTHGTKIEEATKLQSKGHPIAILRESWWMQAIESANAP